MRLGAVGVVLLAAPAAAQGDADRAIQRIRADYAAMQAAHVAWESAGKRWVGAGGEGAVALWRAPDDGRRRLAVRFDGDGASWVREYYLRSDTVFFAFDRWETFPEVGEPSVHENRYYLDGPALLRWLVRTSPDGPNQPQDPEDAEYLDAARRVPQQAACWLRFLTAAGTDWDAWAEETGCAYVF